MRVLITGATGLIGGQIVKACLAQGFRVNYLTTRKDKIKDELNLKGYYWNPESGDIDQDCFSNVSVIIHLAGANIAKRWTASYKEKIVKSRTSTTSLLYASLVKTKNTSVKQLISASAIGIYPSSFTDVYHEENALIDDSFLGEVVEDWENTVDAFKMLNIKVSKIRTGLVLSNSGGFLKPSVTSVKMFLGAPLASGNQWQSWVHINDLVGIYMHLLKNEKEGVYNGVAPNPVTNKEMTREIAKILKKPFYPIGVPKFLLKLILGEMSCLVICSQNVSADKVLEEGYVFEFTDLKDALVDLLV
ncbi:NAD-dependent epimerase [Neptunitalea chrysea]|uniref:NAD-dependent epimerase n=1 Tax=Neptunitalea chrysea TaxID=1647581 RepID=A0A9W6B6X8_9FLAO|nr:TIGR01777 family oxidoreductase [Neptunitalea chrysea]GLB53859.1 NAD-dependent epimerase [Neptunitalea chrysea]